jgi:putative acyl-CoA dehydrogenase
MAEVELAAGADGRLDRHIDAARTVPALLAGSGEDAPYLARRVVGGLALVLQASLVARHSPPEVSDAFIASRLEYRLDRTFGTLPAGVDAGAIVERHRPKS